MKASSVLNLAGLSLLIAAASARADEPASASPTPAAAAVTVAAAPPVLASEWQATPSDAALPPLQLEMREAASPSRPAKSWITRGEVDSGSYRMSLSRGKFDMGVGFDQPLGVAQRSARGVDPSAPIVPTTPSLSIGLRSDSAGPAPSSLLARATAVDGTTPSSSRRVGLEWKPAQSSLFVRGGLRLTSDERITMRVKGGRVGVYMKSTF